MIGSVASTSAHSDNILSTSLSAGEPSRIDVPEEDHPLSNTSKEAADGSVGIKRSRELGQSAEPNSSTGTATPPRSAGNTDVVDSQSDPMDQSGQPEQAAETSTNQQADHTDQGTGNDARNVRRNMLLTAWNGFSHLTKGRKWILILRLLIGLAQLVLGIAILSLPTSLGDSYSTPETCNPEGMFVFLTLHLVRVFCSIPIDGYLGLSPHRTPRSRREGAEGLLDRERTRAFGSLPLDRKVSRFSDLLGFCHIILFIVGNYIVWTSVECSHTPAESRPLWITCVVMLSLTYVIILEVALMIFLIVFFLPLLIAILRALGLAHRLPQREIHPETGKINQSTIDDQSRLVYFTLKREEGDDLKISSGRDRTTSREDLDMLDNNEVDTRQGDQKYNGQAIEDAIAIPLPLSRTTTTTEQSRAPLQHPVALRPPRRKRLGLLFGYGRKAKAEKEETIDLPLSENESNGGSHDSAKAQLKYPLYPIPAHRATCPICLCDFEEVDVRTGGRQAESNEGKEVETHTNDESGDGVGEGDQVEPLRLLDCGHVMHMTCVDQWLTTVSGRCPVCQKAIVPSEDVSPSGTS